ncbi:MAG: type III secretion system inner rod subunit SctI [Enterobacteriaceae bacterium]
MDATAIFQSGLLQSVTDKLAQQDAAPADQALIDKFSQLMKTGSSELSKIKEVAGLDGTDLQGVNATTPPDIISVQKALESQNALTNLMVTTDLATKVAAYLSSSINKLVNLQ